MSTQAAALDAGIHDTTRGRCTSAVTIRGESFRCDLAAQHDGWAHSSRDAEAIWRDGR